MKSKKGIFLVIVCIALVGDLTNFLTIGNNHYDTAEYTSLKLANITTKPFWNFSVSEAFTEVDISSDGEYITAMEEGEWNVYLFNKSSPNPLWNYSLGERGTSLAISSDGVYIVVGDMEGNLFLFHRASGIPLWNYTAGDHIRSVAISSNGSYIAVGTNSERVYLFSYNSSIPIWSYDTNRMMVSVAISSSGDTIVAMGRQDRLFVFGKNSSTPIWIYTNDYTPKFGFADYFLSLSSDGDYIALGIYAEGGRVCLFNKSSNIPIWIADLTNRTNSVKISSDGNYIVAGTSKGNVSKFKKESNNTVWSYKINEAVDSVAISSNGEFIAVVGEGLGGEKNTIYCFNKSLVTPVWEYRLNRGFLSSNVGMSADGKVIVVTDDNKVFLFSRDISFEVTVKNKPKPKIDMFLISFGFLTFFSLVAVTVTIYFKRKKSKKIFNRNGVKLVNSK